LLSFGKHFATFKRKQKAAGTPVSEKQEELIRNAFIQVLTAPTPEAYQQALDELPEAFEDPALASRKQSLIEKQPLFQAWIHDRRLAVVTTALDQCMKFLNRKFENMQTFRGPKSALATVNVAFSQGCQTSGFIPFGIGWC
jgi:hypothetical protein